MASRIEKLCEEKNIKLTKNRRIIAQVISDSSDHPDVEILFKRVSKIEPSIGIATVYRTISLFEEGGVITKHDFGEGKSRYEEFDECHHHDHIVDVVNSEVIEFFNEDLERLKERIVNEMGYELVDHRLELYVRPLKK